MDISLSKLELSSYLKNQLNNYFPDSKPIQSTEIIKSLDLTLDRLENCLSKAQLNRYKKDGKPYFNHLFSDTYMLFLCYLGNTVWNETQDIVLASKIYYLNKTMHSFDCMYDNKIPEVFLIVHGVGTIMGKAEYGNYFVIYQGCTVGASHGIYPKIGTGVSVTANSSVIGKCIIGDRATISTRTTVFQKDVPKDYTAFVNWDNGVLEMKKSNSCYAQQFFHTDLKTL